MPVKSDHAPSNVSVPLWAKAAVILCVVLTGAGAVIALVNPGMLLQSHAEITSAVRIYAGYLTSRNAVLAIMLLMLLILKAHRALGNLLAIAGLIQVLDSVIDCVENRWTIAPGVLLLGIIFLLGASRICGPPWRRAAWI